MPDQVTLPVVSDIRASMKPADIRNLLLIAFVFGGFISILILRLAMYRDGDSIVWDHTIDETIWFWLASVALSVVHAYLSRGRS